MTIMGTAIISASVARSDDKKVRSVGCLIMGVEWAFFALSDGYALMTGAFDGAMKDGTGPIVANLVLFSVMAFVLLLGWKESGSVTPKLGEMVPKGRCKTPLLVALVNNAFFGLGLALFTRAFMEMYIPGILDALPGPGKRGAGEAISIPLMIVMMGNAGKTILFGSFATLAVCSIGDEDASYKLLRGQAMHSMFYLGTFAREGVIAAAAGWPQPMRTASFFQCFAATFYMVNATMAIPYKLAPDAAKKK